MAEPKSEVTEQEVTVEALVVLRDEKNKKVPVGKTLKVPKSTADILVDNKKAKLVK